MSAAKHTPGPWHVATLRTCVNADSGTVICQVTGSESNESSVADARLIAAAPELLEAMQAIERRLTHLAQDSVPVVDELKLARAAIAKATGEQQ